MDTQKILEQWKQDSELDPNELTRESNRIPQLHAKYLELLSQARSEMKAKKQELKKLQFDKYEYFTGRISTAKLSSYGWKPFPYKILKNDIDRYIEADDDILAKRAEISSAEEKVEVLESILDSINKRTFVIKNSIDFLKFTNGI